VKLLFPLFTEIVVFIIKLLLDLSSKNTLLAAFEGHGLGSFFF